MQDRYFLISQNQYVPGFEGQCKGNSCKSECPSALGEPTSTENYGDEGTAGSVIDPLIELHSVVDADSSQIEAIEMAKSGKSFVLQGPPGTGKKPDDYQYHRRMPWRWQKVLFVSEKLAA